METELIVINRISRKLFYKMFCNSEITMLLKVIERWEKIPPFFYKRYNLIFSNNFIPFLLTGESYEKNVWFFL